MAVIPGINTNPGGGGRVHFAEELIKKDVGKDTKISEPISWWAKPIARKGK
jgi:hypothetical protein